MRCQRHIYTFAACERTCSICCATVFGGGGHKVFALHCGCVAWQQRDEIAEIKSINADIRLHTTAIFMFIYARMRSFLFTLRLPVCVYLKFLWTFHLQALFVFEVFLQHMSLHTKGVVAHISHSFCAALSFCWYFSCAHVARDRPTDYLSAGTIARWIAARIAQIVLINWPPLCFKRGTLLPLPPLLMRLTETNAAPTALMLPA